MTDKPVFVMPDLTGPQGNAFVLLGQAKQLMKDAGYPEEAMRSFHAEATSGDYDHLLATIRNWFRVARVRYVLEEEEED
jgi:hypothetical protein